MKPVYFPIVFTTNQWTVIKLCFKKEFISKRRFDQFTKGVTLASSSTQICNMLIKPKFGIKIDA